MHVSLCEKKSLRVLHRSTSSVMWRRGLRQQQVSFLKCLAKFTYFKISICMSSGSLCNPLTSTSPLPFSIHRDSQSPFVPDFTISQCTTEGCFPKWNLNQTKPDWHWHSDIYQFPTEVTFLWPTLRSFKSVKRLRKKPSKPTKPVTLHTHAWTCALLILWNVWRGGSRKE